MDSFVIVTKSGKRDVYEEILPQIESLIRDETDLVANLANTASVLRMAFPDRISWVGFYLARANELVLGPFQGKPACVRVQLGRGVCGTAALSRKTVIVPNVDEFPGHIVCDPDSRSEIVIPMLRGENLLAVLDVDSSSLGSFDETDKEYLEKIGKLLEKKF
ncbi:MAG: GAF domain-containing protein [Ignavibacteriales bacterium]|nr:GAF domain-containing protein [Ignavibacteriales bacterium]